MRVAIIPARGGSRRIPRKNVRMFHGKPIICYSIEIARASGLFDLVAVSTDDGEIKDMAIQYGAGVIDRPDPLATDETGTQAVMRHALETFISQVDTACCIYATAPLMRIESLKWGLHELDARPDIAYAFSVGYPPLQDAAQFYWGRANAFLIGKPLVWPNVAMIPIPANRVCDINTPEDWTRAEAMYAALHHDDRVAYG